MSGKREDLKASEEVQRSVYSLREHSRLAFLLSEKIVVPKLSLGTDRAFRYNKPL